MGRIQASTGLVSGIDYTSIVQQLIEIESKPMKNLSDRNDKLIEQQTALTDLTSQLLTTSYMLRNLAKASVYSRRDLHSSNDSVVKVTQNGTPVEGTYSVTSVRMAQAFQAITSGVASKTNALGKTGTISIGTNARDLVSNVKLSDLNGGEGFQRGYIRITDKSGQKATIDLRYAETMDDVIKAINDNTDIDVYASIDGYCLTMTDESGGTGTLSVRDVSGGSTAKSLGFYNSTSGGDTTTSTGSSITGHKIQYVSGKTALSTLNDGNGIELDKYLPDIKYTLRDGTTGTIDFNKIITYTDAEREAADEAGEILPTHKTEQTLEDIIATINADGQGKLTASIDSTGLRLVITDTTTGSETFKLEDTNTLGVSALRSLGFLSSAESSVAAAAGSEDTIQSRLLLAELDSVLTSSLHGGRGLFTTIQSDEEGNSFFRVQDATGHSEVLKIPAASLKGLDTLEQVINVFNDSFDGLDLKLKMELNESKTGVNLVSTTGATTSPISLVDVYAPVDPADPSGTQFVSGIAALFGFGTSSTSGTLYGASLGLQTLSYNTKLADMKGGTGIDTYNGNIFIQTSDGKSDLISFSEKNIETLGDLVAEINGSKASVLCRINSAGDGLVFYDYSENGTGNFTIRDLGSSTVATQLGISKTITPESGVTPSFTTSYANKIEVESTDSLQDICDKINKLDGGFTASIISDGSSTPHRLSITSKQTGEIGNLQLNFEALGMTTNVINKGQDAIVVYGDPDNPNAIIVNSRTNTIKDLIPGMSITLAGTSTTPVNVWSEQSSVEIKASLKSFVENYNKFRETLLTYNYYDTTKEEGGLLWTNSVARQMDRDYTNMLLKVFPESMYGNVRSLADVGLTLVTGDTENKGLVEFDEDKFDRLFESDPEGIKNFFAKEQDTYTSKIVKGEVVWESKKVGVGYATKFGEMADSIVGETYSSATVMNNALDRQILENEKRIEFMAQRLLAKQNHLLKKFYYMETTLAKIQSQSEYVSKIAASASSS